MALYSADVDVREDASGLEAELHEGDGRIPRWLWLVVAVVVIFAAVAAPFQLFWPFG